MEATERYEAAQRDMQARAAEMHSVLIASQYGAGGGYIENPAARDASISEAAMKSPLYSSMGEELGCNVAKSHASAVRDFARETNGQEIPADLLAACHQGLENLFQHNEEISKNTSNLLLSSISEKNLSSEQGVAIRATTAALTLPVMLANPMNVIAAYLPTRKGQTEIFNVMRIAGSTLGDFKKNEVIHELSYGQYSRQRQRYVFSDEQSPNGTRKTYVFKTKTDVPAQREMPIRPNSVVIYHNRKLAAKQTEGGALFGQITLGDKAFTITGSVDSDKCEITVNTNEPLPDNTTLHAEFHVNIEADKTLIPRIDHKMVPFKCEPHVRVITADASIMSMFSMQTEFGVDTNAMNLSSMRDWLANEKALGVLDDLMFHVSETANFDAEVPKNTGETWKDRYEYIQGLFIKLDTKMKSLNKESGIKAIYAGTLVSTFLQMLPSYIFERSPRSESSPRIHKIGTLLGRIQVFEVPHTKLVAEDKALLVGRTDKIGKAPYYTGDVIPPTLYSHEVDRALNKANTLWANGYDCPGPDCDKYLIEMTLQNFTGE